MKLHNTIKMKIQHIRNKRERVRMIEGKSFFSTHKSIQELKYANR